MDLFKKQKPKIFCISFQRTGTTSTGNFFKEHGFNVQGYDSRFSIPMTKFWFDRDYESIFKNQVFKNNQVFEDNPWWCNDFYKYLYHKFPNAKFVLLERDPDKWFDSMMSHSDGKTLGNTYRHCKLYNREKEYFEFIGDKPIDNDSIDNLLEINETHRGHYKEIYINRNREILNFFKRHDESRLVHTQLEDKDKWEKIGRFFNFQVNKNYESHKNKTTK